ncbi:MAG TPA: aminotransferase class I/II-fold pyridoxal phosphate-dependent enzyme [Longimicrobiales bacterium]|nr:aminotransferase class I/II-fold pyridoxal phosphate-dependent enzyme [Longimicrobiales bacterium]
MKLPTFVLERWQSTWENRVDINLSESGVHPLTVGELQALTGDDDLFATLLGYGQTNGSERLREHIAALYEGAAPTHVSVTNGGAEANFVALWELVLPGAPVVMLLPTYMQGHGLARAFGARLREVWLREERGWQPDPEEIEEAAGDDARVIVVTNPGNPTGTALSEDARAAVLRAAERSGAWILADEVYAGAELEGDVTASFWGAAERVVCTGSLSKAYGLPGLRMGWAVAPEELAERLWARTDYTTIAPSVLSDRLASDALRPDVRPRILARTRAILRRNLPVVRRWVDATPGLSLHPPVAGAIAYVGYTGGPDSDELAARILEETSVLVVPGSQFGMGRYLRIGYGIGEAELEEGLGRVGEVLATVGVG